LYGELLHVPCLLRVAGATPAPPRRAGLATPTDFGATLARWLNIQGSEESQAGVDLLADESPRRQFVASFGADGQRALRTPQWMLRQTLFASGPGGGAVELYVKPDDRWEANEVVDRCPDVAESLLAILDRVESSPDSTAFEPLPGPLNAEQ
jgi:hypothetical protein